MKWPSSCLAFRLILSVRWPSGCGEIDCSGLEAYSEREMSRCLCLDVRRTLFLKTA